MPGSSNNGTHWVKIAERHLTIVVPLASNAQLAVYKLHTSPGGIVFPDRRAVQETSISFPVPNQVILGIILPGMSIRRAIAAVKVIAFDVPGLTGGDVFIAERARAVFTESGRVPFNHVFSVHLNPV